MTDPIEYNEGVITNLIDQLNTHHSNLVNQSSEIDGALKGIQAAWQSQGNDAFTAVQVSWNQEFADTQQILHNLKEATVSALGNAQGTDNAVASSW